MSESKDLEFLATKSKELIDKQIASYRQQHTTAASIVAIIAVFIPLFLGGLDDAYEWVKYFSLFAVGLFIVAICILLFFVFRSQNLSQAIGFNKFTELVNYNDYDKVLLVEIGANQSSFQDNKRVLIKRNRFYNFAVLITTIAIIISVTLLIISKFFKPLKKKEPIQVEVMNRSALNDSTKKDTTFIIIQMLPDSTIKQKKVVRRKPYIRVLKQPKAKHQ